MSHRSATAEFPSAVSGRAGRLALVAGIAVFLALGSLVATAPGARAALPSDVWTGAGQQPPWSLPANWTLGKPQTESPLVFPALPSSCTSSSAPTTCYRSTNDLTAMSPPSVTLDGGSSYLITGNPVTLGSGGLTDEGGSVPAPAKNTLHFGGSGITLGADQTWTVSGNPDMTLAVQGNMGGDKMLGVDLSGGPTVTLGGGTPTGDDEVGPVTVTGTPDTNTGTAAAANGTVELLNGASLNATDGNGVQVTDAGFGGKGSVGPLTTTGADVVLGDPTGTVPGALAATSATFDPATNVGYTVVGTGTTAGTDYTQLTSTGTVDLGGSSLTGTFGTSSLNCPAPVVGTTYVVVSTTGSVTGTFGNLDTNDTIPITLPAGCPSTPYRLLVQYHTGSSPETVTATVVAPSGLPSNTAVTVSPLGGPFGTTVTYSAVVTPQSGTGVPTGSVSFTVGTTPVCTIDTLTPGTNSASGSCMATNAPVGDATNDVTGAYSGDSTFAPSNGNTTLDITLAPTTTAVTLSQSTVNPGTSVTYSATVTPLSGSGPPTGTVTFKVGATTLCTTPPLVGTGTSSGSCAATNAPPGTDTVTGTYSGDSDYATSSGPATLTVRAVATVSGAVDPTPVLQGRPVRYSATVTASGGTPTGTVTATIGATTLCTMTLSGGTGDCFATNAPLGANTVVFSYSGDSAVGPGVGGASIDVLPSDNGYWLVASDGGIFSFGAAHYYGSTGAIHLNKPIVGMAATPDGRGYWLVASDGGIFSFGDAHFYGSTGGIHLNKPIVGMAATWDGKGYWLVASDGGIFSFGDAKFHGSTGAIALNKPVVGMASTPDSQGYWLVATDGGIFSFGDARYHGSTGAIALNKPVVGMAATQTGNGYWLAATDGGIFSFGDARYHGSTGAIHLNKPVVGMMATLSGGGYWLVATDGGIFSFGDARYYGSTGAIHLNEPMVGGAVA